MNAKLNMRRSSFDAEKAFENVVRSCGGSRVSEHLPSNCDLPENADFVFKEYNVISELKCLMEDPRDKESFADQITSLHKNYADKGLAAPVYGTKIIDIRRLYPDHANEIMSILKGRLDLPIKKANKQIRKTKDLLSMPDAKGLLILVQDGSYLIGPEATFSMASRILRPGMFRNIHDIIHVNASIPATYPGDPMRYTFFIPAFRDRNDRVNTELITRLGDGWRTELERTTGGQLQNLGVMPTETFLQNLAYPRVPSRRLDRRPNSR